MTDLLPDYDGLGSVDHVVFSGGVSEHVYDHEVPSYGDVGPYLGKEIRERIAELNRADLVKEPTEGIRATVIGAGEYTIQASGNTSGSGSASTSEIFAAGLKDHGRVRLFGEPSAAAALPSVIEEMPNGDLLMHAIADFIRPSGERIEGRPVQPESPVALTREGLLAGRDEPREEALRWIVAELRDGNRTWRNDPLAAESVPD